MSRSKYLFTVLPLLVILLAAGCISIGLQTTTKPAKGVEVEAPAAPFRSFQDAAFDRAWRNSRTRAILSYKSECGVPQTNSDRILIDLRQIIPDLNVNLTSQTPVDGRDAEVVDASGSFDGRRVRIRFAHYRKSHCNFLISLQSTADQFEQDLSTFNRFLAQFKSP